MVVDNAKQPRELSDTDRAMLRFQLDGYRHMLPEEKLARVQQLNRVQILSHA